MINIELTNPATCIISAKKPKYEGLIFHGYGSNKEEILGLAVKIAKKTRSKILLQDLPGHGSNEDRLNLKNAFKFVEQSILSLNKPRFIIGHSLGARLALLANIPNVIAISMPGNPIFEGNRKELIKTLRVRRVKEEKPFEGLNDVLSKPTPFNNNALLLKASQDIDSVNELWQKWQKLGAVCHRINDCSHLDIISASQTEKVISKWLKERL